MTTAYISQTQFGKNEEFYLQVARGQIQGHKNLFKFGNNPDSNGDLETVWSQSSLYAYPTSAIANSSAIFKTNSTASGTGTSHLKTYKTPHENRIAGTTKRRNE